MEQLFLKVGHAFLLSFGMFWNVGWSLILGFLISAILQVFVSKDKMSAALGRDGAKEIALAAGFGAASSSCSYASTAIVRTLIQKGAGFISSLAFLFASTNLVIELGIVLFLLMGWQFMMAEWVGGIVLIVMMAILVRLTYPKKLVEEARTVANKTSSIHDHHSLDLRGKTFWQKFMSRDAHIAIAHSFVMDWSMLWKDLLAGFLIAGFLAQFISNDSWQTFFSVGSTPLTRLFFNAALGPMIAVVTFVCSIGNIPMAAVLWGAGIRFGGVLSFLYADLIVLPLLDVYRRYFGWKMAAYIAIIFYITMVLSAIVVDVAFTALDIVPTQTASVRESMTHFSFNYTFWLNLLLGSVGLYLARLAARKPIAIHHDHCSEHSVKMVVRHEPSAFYHRRWIAVVLFAVGALAFPMLGVSILMGLTGADAKIYALIAIGYLIYLFSSFVGLWKNTSYSTLI